MVIANLFRSWGGGGSPSLTSTLQYTSELQLACSRLTQHSCACINREVGMVTNHPPGTVGVCRMPGAVSGLASLGICGEDDVQKGIFTPRAHAQQGVM